MSGIFLRLVNMSIAASWIVLVVAALRLLLQRAPRWLHCLLWGMVGLRLVMPFSLKSVFSLVPQVDARDIPYPGNPGNLGNLGGPSGLGGHGAPNIRIPAPAAGVPAGTPPPVPAPGDIAAGQAPDLLTVLSVVWLAGCAVMLAYALLSYLRLHRRVGASIRLRENIFVCDDIASPFLLGILHPRVYLPSGIPDEQVPYIVAHETAHQKRMDHLWKPLGFALLAVYWFNPVLWLAYSLFCRDIELACDEKVVRWMDRETRQAYSLALLSCAAPRRTILISPLAFGEVGIKKRIKSVLHYRRPAFWLTLAAAVVCVVVGVCFLTDPYGTDDPPPVEDGSSSDDAVVDPAPGRRELTADEIARINAAFDPETGSNIRPGPLSVYLVTNYETPYDLTLSKFLTGFPLDMDQVVSGPGELEILKEQDYWPFRHDVNLDTAPALPGLLLRIPAAQVEERLREGFGIGLEDLTYTPDWNLLYLEETDCFYRIANEVRFGYFTCTEGYLEGDTAVLLDENGTRRLELRRSGDQWLFYSLTGSEPYDDFLYYDPLMIYGTAAQGQDDNEIAPDQSVMPTQTGWADETQVQRYQTFLDIMEPTQMGSFLIFLSPNERSQRVDLTWEQSMWFLDQLRTVRLAAAQPTELGADDTGDTVSLHIIGLGEQWTIRHRGDRLYFGRYRDNTMWIFDGESCAGIFQTMREAAQTLLTAGPNTVPATVAYPELVPEVLTASPLYAEALSRPSAILYNGEPFTDRAPVDAFLKALERGEAGELYLYDFTEHSYDQSHTVFFAHFLTNGGRIQVEEDYCYDWEGPLDPSVYSAHDVYLSDYGYLVYHINDTTSPSGEPVIDPREIFPDYEELTRLLNTYVYPLDYTATGDDWDWPGRPPSNWVWLFETLYYHENGHLPYEDYGDNWPVEEMIATVNRYFDGVTRQMIITSNYRAAYDAATDTLHYVGGRGGAPDPLRVIGWEQNGSLLTVYYESYDRETGMPYAAPDALTVELMEDGSFRYRSCHPAA